MVKLATSEVCYQKLLLGILMLFLSPKWQPGKFIKLIYYISFGCCWVIVFNIFCGSEYTKKNPKPFWSLNSTVPLQIFS